jgi:hypothetical protein
LLLTPALGYGAEGMLPFAAGIFIAGDLRRKVKGKSGNFALQMRQIMKFQTVISGIPDANGEISAG